MRKLFTLLLFISLAAQVFAQKITVTGRIVDKKGNAIAGATVTENGITNSTLTDATGSFKIEVQKDAVIEISMADHETQRVKIDDENKEIKVQLKYFKFRHYEFGVLTGYGMAFESKGVKLNEFNGGVFLNVCHINQHHPYRKVRTVVDFFVMYDAFDICGDVTNWKPPHYNNNDLNIDRKTFFLTLGYDCRVDFYIGKSRLYLTFLGVSCGIRLNEDIRPKDELAANEIDKNFFVYCTSFNAGLGYESPIGLGARCYFNYRISSKEDNAELIAPGLSYALTYKF